MNNTEICSPVGRCSRITFGSGCECFVYQQNITKRSLRSRHRKLVSTLSQVKLLSLLPVDLVNTSTRNLK